MWKLRKWSFRISCFWKTQNLPVNCWNTNLSIQSPYSYFSTNTTVQISEIGYEVLSRIYDISNMISNIWYQIYDIKYAIDTGFIKTLCFILYNKSFETINRSFKFVGALGLRGPWKVKVVEPVPSSPCKLTAVTYPTYSVNFSTDKVKFVPRIEYCFSVFPISEKI